MFLHTLFLFFLFHFQMTEFLPSSTITTHRDSTLFSTKLNRQIVLDIILPANVSPTTRLPVLFMNDGQDLERLNMKVVLEKQFSARKTPPFVLVAIHCGDRMQEYGVASQADYKKRGSKAGLYNAFILTELLPHIRQQYHTSLNPDKNIFCGFSLGGLSAFDMVWNNATVFGKVGVFSGSFWWRQRAYENAYSDEKDRIAHNLVKNNVGNKQLAAGMKFWLQTGTNDEQEDRNKNGIIDSIDDTLDLIKELEKKGFHQKIDIEYVEVVGGQHNQGTWSAVMPQFLDWAFN